MKEKNQPGKKTTDQESKVGLKNKKTLTQIRNKVVIHPDSEASGKALQEEKSSTAVMSFGRMNPPTAGHEKLVKKLHSVAKKHGGDSVLFLSHSEGTTHDPLPQSKKIEYAKKAFPSTRIEGSSKESPNFLSAAKKLHGEGYQHLVVVAGQDRVKEYHDTLHKYNGHPDHYNFKSIHVVSAGKRDPDATDITGMSASKVRAHARAGNKAKFKAGLASGLQQHANEIYNHIRSIHEQTIKERVMLKESSMSDLDADIGMLMDNHIAHYKKVGGAEHLMSKAHHAAKKISSLYNLKHEHAHKFVSDYIESHLKDVKENYNVHMRSRKGGFTAKWRLNVPDLEQAKKVADDAQAKYGNARTSFHVFDKKTRQHVHSTNPNVKHVLFSEAKQEEEEEHEFKDSITLNIPLFIRLMEYAREDAKKDIELHLVAERAVKESARECVLDMDDYEYLITGKAEKADADDVKEETHPYKRAAQRGITLQKFIKKSRSPSEQKKRESGESLKKEREEKEEK